MDTVLKKQIIDKLIAIDDNELLMMVKEDIDWYETAKAKDTTDILTDGELKELKSDFNIPVSQDSMTLNEFQQSIRRWLTK